MKNRDRKFTPTLAANTLEDRSLLAAFGGGNFDFSRPFVTNPTLPAAAVNFTSNAYHQIQNSIDGVAGNILKNINNHNAVINQLGRITSKVPFGGRLKAILATDIQALQRGGSIDTTQAAAVVNDLFGELLDRDPGAFGRNIFVPQVQAGTTVKQLTRVIVTSDEFLAKNTSETGTALENQTELVTALYEDVLGRTPEPSGLSFWVDQIDAGADPRGVALAFVNSFEASTSATSILRTVPAPTPSGPDYFFGVANADGSIPGPFRGTSTKARIADLIFADLNAYLDQGEGTSFNVLKSRQNFSSDIYLTFNGRVR